MEGEGGEWMGTYSEATGRRAGGAAMTLRVTDYRACCVRHATYSPRRREGLRRCSEMMA